MSFGKYDKPLDFKGEDTESSLMGGLITMLILIIMIGFSTRVMVSIFNRNKYQLDVAFTSIIVEL